MAATGYTPISLYYSITPTVVPTNTNLANGELGINITDGKLYYKDNAGVVQLLASKAAAAGGVTATNADNLKNTGAVSTNSTFFVNFLSNNTTSYQGSNTSATLALNPSTGTLFIGLGAALGGTTNPLVAASGNTNNYVQNYIYNASSGTSASADIAAYADNSTDAHGWVDLGYASSTYADSVYTVTGPNEAYILGSAPSGAGATGNLVYATDSTGSANAHQWYVGGFTQAKGAWKMQLTSTGLQLANALAAAYGGTGLSASGTSGNLLSSNGTTWTSASLSSLTIPTYTSTNTFTNKRVTPRIDSTTSATTITPTGDASDQYNVTALATTASFAIPSGTPTDGQKLSIRIKDNGTGQTISWVTTAGGYRVIGTTLPTTTTANKTIYVGCVYNAADAFWDVVAVATQA